VEPTQAPVAQAVSAAFNLPGVKVLLEGPTGTGKTHALGTLVDWCAAQTPPIQCFALFLERGLETLLGYWVNQGKPIPANLHWRDLITKPVSLSQMKDAAVNVGKLTYDSITKLTDGQRSLNNPFEQMLIAHMEFIDDRTGQKFGPVDGWGPDRVLITDSLTEACNAASKMVIGSKPTMAPGEYGIAQNNLMNWLRLCTQGCRCHFVLTAHVSREKDEMTGGIKLMTQAIGGAISGLIPPLFSEVILTTREGASWFWDTANANVDLKSRYLPISSKITPHFATIMDKWTARAKAAAVVPVSTG
jgi:hypothetical protein